MDTREETIARIQTQKAQSLLIGYAFHPVSANMPWHGSLTLQGMCAIGAVLLTSLLEKEGLEAHPVFGEYRDPTQILEDDQSSQGNKHCWSICHLQETPGEMLICDPTIRQFWDERETPLRITSHQESRQLGFHPKSKPNTFKNWPEHCHPLAKNALGCDHQTWLNHHQKPWTPSPK